MNIHDGYFEICPVGERSLNKSLDNSDGGGNETEADPPVDIAQTVRRALRASRIRKRPDGYIRQTTFSDAKRRASRN